MKYADSIDELKIHVWNNCFKKRKIVKASEELIVSHLEMVDAILQNIEETERQIKKWEDLQSVDAKYDFHEEIDLFHIIVEFYRVNGRLVLLELDVSTAYKHIFIVRTDYEYRFFARRLYTLMYEANKGLVIPAGQLYKKLADKLETRSLEPYKSEHSKLHDFLSDHEDELKDVRNSNEAHKFRDFEVQLKSIEKMSVARSIELIQEFNVYLANLTMVFMIVQGALSKKLGEIMRNQIERM